MSVHATGRTSVRAFARTCVVFADCECIGIVTDGHTWVGPCVSVG